MCEFCENRKEIELESETTVSHWSIIRGQEYSRLYCRMGNVSNSYGIKIYHCPICGRKLTDESEKTETRPLIHAHAIIDWLVNPKCSNCGSHIDVTEPYCQHCGASLDEPEEKI